MPQTYRYSAEIATTTELLSYWRLNEPSGTVASNQVTTGSAGAYVNTPTLGQAGPLADRDLAVLLNGTNEYVSVGSVAALRPVDYVTLEAFFKATALTGNRIIAGCGNAGNNGYLLYLSGSTLTWRVGNGTTAATSTFTVSAGVWYHVVAVFTGTALILYVDGVQRDTDALAGDIIYGSVTDFHIGQRHGIAAGEYFNGTLDEVSVYGRPLDAAEVTAHYRAIGSTRVKAELHLELAGIGNGWTSVTDDFIVEATWDQGLPGSGIIDRVADTGVLNVWLNNSENNSGAAVGYYSPNHASKRSGFGLGIRARLRITPAAVPRIEFVGKVSSISPAAGMHGQRLTRLEVLDWMDESARTRLQGVELQEDKQGHELFLAALAEASHQPEAVSYDSLISETYPYAFDSAHDETTTLMSEFQRIATSSLALVYMDGQVLRYESRAVRARVTSDFDTFEDEQLVGLDAGRNRDNVLNHVQLLLRQRRLGTSTDEVLWQLQTPFKISPGQVVDPVMGPYVDPTGRAKRVGGTDMQAPIPVTDYTANTDADGGGTDMTTFLSFSTSAGANGVRFTLRNTGISDLWVTKLQIRGRGIYYGEMAAVEASDLTSLAQFGRNSTRMDMQYQSDLTLAGEAAQYFVSLYKDPLTFADSAVTSAGMNDGDWMDRILRRRISDRISIAEAVTGLGNSFFINRRSVRMTAALLTVSWMLAPADTTAYWLLEVPGRSELDTTTVLGFGTIVGHTDVAHGDSHSDTAHFDTAHTDTKHTDTHSDAGHTDSHGDGGHGDSHNDGHDDTSHSDSHNDTAHADASHTDVGHGDSHSDGAHDDLHQDVDIDGDPPTHFDGHVDSAHGDGHDDTSHDDGAHEDTSHSDAHNDTAHDDDHGDSHDDSGHTDTHADAGHADTHSDIVHGDVNHVDVSHGDTHSDTAHSDIN